MPLKYVKILITEHCVVSVQVRVISGPYFPVFGLNTEIYSVDLRIQFEYKNIRTRNNSLFGHFSCSGGDSEWSSWKIEILTICNNANRKSKQRQQRRI